MQNNDSYLKFNSNNSNYNPNANLFTLFTSGSTGKPKAVIHSVEKYLNYAEFTTDYFWYYEIIHNVYSYRCRWINGHTYALFMALY